MYNWGSSKKLHTILTTRLLSTALLQYKEQKEQQHQMYTQQFIKKPPKQTGKDDAVEMF